MTKLTFLLMLVALGCGLVRNNGEESITGVYVRSAPDKNGILFDTVAISVVNIQAHQFLVAQRLHYRRKGGQQLLKDFSRENYAAYYNTSKNVLEIPEVMGFLTFDAEGMLFGNIRYQKIK